MRADEFVVVDAQDERRLRNRDAVLMRFYPGAATEPGRVFDLTPGPPPFRGVLLLMK